MLILMVPGVNIIAGRSQVTARPVSRIIDIVPPFAIGDFPYISRVIIILHVSLMNGPHHILKTVKLIKRAHLLEF